ncbi:MAG: peptidoglycan-associated lipoprotein Pal, partial [Halioglobus sp.]|nr:peptidoglycan-associated lipoprotein Pal [Halioglobus sp.]
IDMNHYKMFSVCMLALILSACSKTPTLPDPEPNSEVGSGMDGAPASGSRGWETDGLDQGEEFEDDLGNELGMILYFDFDQSELRPEYADLLAKHANRLANNPSLNVRLEGHADERGSREYNIGLGERRAQTVRRMMLLQGASANQISTVSFEEERSATFGSDEGSYQQNRRVEIKYLN